MRIFTVDAFAAEPFTGNPAGVCLLDSPRPESWMQQVAAEMHHSETAFVLGGDAPRSLRWFTPSTEVDLCGHATLAAAHVLYELGESSGEIAFSTRSGELRATQVPSGIELDFPALVPEPIAVPLGLADVLGFEPLLVARYGESWLALAHSAAMVRELAPDLTALVALPITALCVTAEAETSSGVDFISRYFRPVDGIPEDPVTGSAHCALGPFWSERLGRTHLTGYQASPRGGRVEVEVRGKRVGLIGRACTIVRGEID